MAVLPHPPEVPGEPNDKVAAYRRVRDARAARQLRLSADRAWRLLVGLSLFGALIEVVQAIPALHRDSDI